MKKDLVIQKLVKIAETQQILLKKLSKKSKQYNKSVEDPLNDLTYAISQISSLSSEEKHILCTKIQDLVDICLDEKLSNS